MGLFGSKESKEDKKLAKMKALAARYHLDDINPKDLESIQSIYYELAGTGLMEFGALLTGAKSEDNLKIAYLNTLIQQNWIIIRQLDEISKKFDK